jgi:hypothetical protein
LAKNGLQYGLQYMELRGIPAFASPSTFYLQIGTKREPTSGLEPLTCSLRVISHVLQGFARSCKYPLSKGFSLLCLALCCSVLRSRWCQSGVNYHLCIRVTLSSASSTYESKSGKPCREARCRKFVSTILRNPDSMRAENRPFSASEFNARYKIGKRHWSGE